MNRRIHIGLAGVAIGACLACAAAEVTTRERDAVYAVRDEKATEERKVTFRELTLENEYLRVVVLPQLGGRVAEVVDKSTGNQTFLKRPIEWPATKYTPYGSQLGGIEVNFPCFHHGNSYLDVWNWTLEKEPDGSASVRVGWTEPDSRQRVACRYQLRAGEAVLRCRYRFSNLTPLALGFAPWVNTFFGYGKDLQYVIPARHVVPHGFNDGTLDVLPWPWPDYDERSFCFWRNIPAAYNSVFALDLERDFSGVYYTEQDRGTVRLFDRTRLPGLKLYHIPPGKLPEPRPTDYLELWSSPALLHEDARWWEGYAVREYEEAYYPVHGIGGFRMANEWAAANLGRGTNDVRVGVYAPRELPGSVVILSSVDGVWWRWQGTLSPARPLDVTVPRPPGRFPLEVRLLSSGGRELLRYEQAPDPGLRTEISFSGNPLWSADPTMKALKAEQYHALWRGPTGGYGDYGAKGAAGWRARLAAEPGSVEARLGLARSLIVDAMLRRSGKPGADPEEKAAEIRTRKLEEAIAVLAALSGDSRAGALAGEAALLLGRADVVMGGVRRLIGERSADLALVEARALASLGDFKEALAAAAFARVRLPGCAEAVQLEAGLQILCGRPADALHALEALRAEDPTDILTVWLLASVERAAGLDRAPARDAEWRRLLDQSGRAALEAGVERLGLHALMKEAVPGSRDRGEGT